MVYFKKYYEKVVSYFNAGHERSIRAKKNIILLFLYKGLAALIGLLIVPLALHYLDSIRYGIWLTLSSIIGWVYFFDIGLGNGLRNKFAEAKASDDKQLTKIYISTTYAILTIIVLFIFITFILINFFLDWTIILNAPTNLKSELNILIIIVFSLFCLGFIAKLINTILVADQRPATSNLISLISNVLTLIFFYLLTIGTKSSLLLAGIVFSIFTSLVSLIATFYYFAKDYKEYKPSFKMIKWEYSKELMSLGIKFFIIQISGLLIFTTTNLIITQFFGPSSVTIYNIAFKYFSVVTMIFGIITTPFWSAYTEAYIRNDFIWIKNITHKLVQVWYAFAALTILMILFSDSIYEFWIGTEISVPFSLSFFMGIYVILLTWNTIFVSFVNGIGKIRLQLLLSIIIAFISIPLVILFGSYLGYGITGVIAAISIAILPSSTIITIQYFKIITNNATGIWNS